MQCFRVIAAALVLGQSVAWASPGPSPLPPLPLGEKSPDPQEPVPPRPSQHSQKETRPSQHSQKKKRVAALTGPDSLVPDPRHFHFTLAEPTLTLRRWRGSPFDVKLGVDLPLIAAGLATGLLPVLVKSKAPDPLSMRALQVNAFDRGAIGKHSTVADGISTGLMAASIILPLAADLVDVLVNKPDDGFQGFAKDLVVLAEVYAVTSMVTNITKIAVHRARPFMYDPATPASERESSAAMQSFFSGHTAAAFAMATAYSYLFTLRHPKSPWIIPVWIGSEALAAATGFLRVEAGKHYWSDVLVGAAVGSAVGFLIPWLHKTKAGKYVSEMMFEAQPGKLRVAPTFLPGGGGVSLKVVW